MSTVRHFDSPTPLLIMFRKQEYLEIRMCKVVQYDMHSMSLEIWSRHHCLIFNFVVVVVVFLLLLLFVVVAVAVFVAVFVVVVVVVVVAVYLLL